MSTVLRSVRGCQRATTFLAAGAAMLLGATEAVEAGEVVAVGGFQHGIGIATQCQGPICVGDLFECTITLNNADEFGDTLRISEAFVQIDDTIRVPPVGNLPVLQLLGNAIFEGVPGELPVLIGGAGSTESGLPGSPLPGVVIIIQNQYIATAADCENAVQTNNFLLSQATVVVQDLCDADGTTGCSTVESEVQFTAAGQISCPTVTIDPPAPIGCANEFPQEVCAVVEGAIGELEYIWTGPNAFSGSTPCVMVSDPGVYTVMVEDDDGCMAEAMVTVTVFPDPMISVEDISTCILPVDLCPVVNSGTPPFTLTYMGPNDAMFLPVPPDGCIDADRAGEYTIRVVDDNGCMDETTAQVMADENPECAISGPAVVCPGQQGIVYTVMETTGTDGATFTWEILGGDAEFCGTPTGESVCVNTTTAPGVCMSSFDLKVTVSIGECTSMCFYSVLIQDDEDPMITCPPDVMVDCPDRIPGPALTLNEFLVQGGSASDDCGVIEFMHVGDTDNGMTCPFVVMRTYRITDACGNTADCVQTLTANDTEEPTITCPDDVLVDCPERIPGPALDLNAFLVMGGAVADNCEVVQVIHVGDTDNGDTCPFIVTRTYRAFDACGNSFDCTQTLTANDTEEPTITCPDDLLVSCPSDTPPPATNLNEFLVQGGMVADNCVVESVEHVGDFMQTMETDLGAGNPGGGLRLSASGPDCLQTINRVYRATDACGLTAECTQVIEINDQEPPSITCPPDAEVSCLPHVPMPALTLDEFLAQGGTASDNCGILDFVYDGDVISPDGCPLFITRTYRVVDTCGNVNTCAQMITVNDQEPPVLTCPDAVMVACPEQLPAPALTLPEFIVQGGTAVDNCGIAEFFFDGDEFGPDTCPRIVTRSYRVTDACGNPGVCTQTITLWDQEDPTITCPPPAFADCPERVPAPAMDLNAFLVMGGTASDNCGITGFFFDGDSSDQQTCPETITRTYRVVDACGNENTCAQTITVDDDEDPTITCPSDVTVACESLVPPPATTLNEFLVQGGEAADNCGITTFMHVGDTLQGVGCPLAIFREYRVADACGNENICIQTITVDDEEPPVVICPPELQVDCVEQIPAPITTFGDFINQGGTIEDNCEVVSIEFLGNIAEGTCPTILTRGYRITDACGNASECERTIIIDDQTPPIITCPPDVNVDCPARIPAPAMTYNEFLNQGGTIEDNCLAEIVTWEGDEIVEGSAGEACPLVIRRRYTSWDLCGNSLECFQTITVNDEENPTITCPPDEMVDCPSRISTAATTLQEFLVIGGEVADNCVVVAVNHLGDTGNGDTCPQTITRTYEAVDACGNTNTCEQTIIVNDEEDPTITCPPDVMFSCQTSVPPPAADLNAFMVMGGTASDNCGIESFSWEGDDDSGTCPRTIARTYMVADTCGNTNTCVQTITIWDQEDPLITCPQDVQVNCPTGVPAAAVDLKTFLAMGGTASDNCGIDEFTHVGDNSDQESCPETITRTYRVTDECGNDATCAQIITVYDEIDPIITCPPDLDVNCPTGVPVPATDLKTFQAYGGTAFDTCGIETFEHVGDDVSLETCPQTILRTYRVADACGNDATCVQTITVDDEIDPTITCPSDLMVSCVENVPAAALSLEAFQVQGGFATDNCGSLQFFFDGDDASTATCPQTITRSYRVVDACGNTVSCQQTIVVNDDEDPTITCPPDGAYDCPARVPAPAADLNAFLAEGGMASDNCGVTGFEHLGDTDSGTCPQTITRTYRVTDACGNTADCSQTILVNDEEDPTITCPADVDVACPEQVPSAAQDLNAFLAQGGVASDNCGIVDFMIASSTNSDTCPQTITRTYTVVDACGNEASCDQVITVNDEEDPTITCPDDVDVACAEQVPAAALDLDAFLAQGGMAADNCSIVDFSVGSSTNSETCPQVITRTYTVIDACGNEASCDQVITVSDEEDPTITCPPDGAYDCPARVPAPAEDLNAFLAEGGMAADNCGIADFEHVGDMSSGTCPLTITRTYRVTDGCGNTADCSQSIVVNDEEDPTITCPADVDVACPEQVPPAADDLNAFLVQGGTATDNCGIVDFSLSTQTSGDGCPQTITRTYTVTDACGNEESCDQVITVNDEEDPMITCPSDLMVECSGEVPPAAMDLQGFLQAGGSASDNCGEVTVELFDEMVDGDGCPQTITRTYRATDACGNTADCMQVITVDDDEAPIITCPPDVTVSCPSEVPPPNAAGGSCVDNCTPPELLEITLVNETQTGECPIIITRTWRCEDECGNSDECDQIITVEDITAPVITCPDDRLDLECGVAEPFMVEATDDCGDVEVTCEIIASSGGPVFLSDLGNGQFTVEFEGTGTATIECTTADACGNPASCTFDVAADCPCTIGDFLWFDLNGDGCQDPGEPGVANVTLVLYRDCDDPVFVASTSTDEDGRYLFEDIDCNTEYVIVIDSTLTETTPDACGDDDIDSDCIDGMICLMTHSDNPVDLRYDCGFVECELSVDLEGCVIPVDDDDIDTCAGKVLELVFSYTAEDCSASSTTQDSGKWNCDTFGDLPDTAYIVVSENEDCSGSIYFAGDVAFGDELVVDPQMAGLVELKSATFACIYDVEGGTLLQSLEFHTSCSQPLGPGNQFGSLLLVQMTTTQGGTVGGPDPDECNTKIVTGGGDCDGDLLTLDLTYTGESCAATSTTQSDDKWDCSGDPAGAEPVRILVSNESGSEVYADVSDVMIGDTVFASAANAGQADFQNQTRVRVYSAGGSLLQDVDFHTSCSQPLGPGDQFGSLFISGLSSTNGGSSQMGGEVEYTYSITNEGPGPVTNVTVIDDVYGEIPGSPIPLIEPGETVVLMITVFVTETTTNTVTVTGNEAGANCTAQDDTTIMVVGPPHDCCENGKPRVLTMLYTAEGCSATSHTQDPGKVNCDDFGPLEDTVYILASDDANPDDGGALVWFTGTVDMGDTFDIDAGNEGLTRLKSTTHIHIFASEGGALLQSVEFHTSCSQDLNEGNQFGASLLVGCLSENEALLGNDSAPAPATPVALFECPADFDTNGVVGTSDMIMIFEFWGPVASASGRYDISGDGQIDTQDLVEIVTSWGPCP